MMDRGATGREGGLTKGVGPSFVALVIARSVGVYVCEAECIEHAGSWEVYFGVESELRTNALQTL
jgi:hypothetical protein